VRFSTLPDARVWICAGTRHGYEARNGPSSISGSLQASNNRIARAILIDPSDEEPKRSEESVHVDIAGVVTAVQIGGNNIKKRFR
jgi:hypothetical protein